MSKKPSFASSSVISFINRRADFPLPIFYSRRLPLLLLTSQTQKAQRSTCSTTRRPGSLISRGRFGRTRILDRVHDQPHWFGKTQDHCEDCSRRERRNSNDKTKWHAPSIRTQGRRDGREDRAAADRSCKDDTCEFGMPALSSERLREDQTEDGTFTEEYHDLHCDCSATCKMHT